MGKYEAFRKYLIKVDEGRNEVTLSFDDIEEILGSTLPQSARRHRPWWGNAPTSPNAAEWIKAGWIVSDVKLQEGQVTFRRTSEDELPQRRMQKVYVRLGDFLKRVPKRQVQIALSFAEVAGIIRQNLPITATKDRTWWANTSASPQGRAWVSVGWYLHSVFLGSSIAVFRRKDERPTVLIREYINELLEGTAKIHHYAADDIIRWIKMCSKIGWYFEGKILYEKAPFGRDAMNEMDRALLDEHYATCCRELTIYKAIDKDKLILG